MRIGFGTLFSVTKETALREGRIDVVVDPETEGKSWFAAAEVTNDGKGEQFSFQTGVGTSMRENIENITGRFSLDEMLAAATLGSLRVVH